MGGVDEDGDGKLDCADADCAAHPACLNRAEHCYNGADDDGDGQADCADPDCATRDVCAGQGEDCLDGFDNDADGQIDCQDWDCARAWVCLRGGEACLDGIDNDADGQVDCADQDCATTYFCLRRGEVCDNQRDDDGDGLADCQDTDCAGTIACMSGGEVCDNRRDDDGDGLADCQDTDCAYTVGCVSRREDCGNGVDDDGDGQVDCADTTCRASSVCQRRVERCEGGVDEDGDGQIDCEDSDCAGVFVCLNRLENCINGVDDNANGDIDCADMLCATHSRCVDRGQEICGNRRDDDGDGQIDCADTDCAMSQTCQVMAQERCDNDLDDDGDGAFDCADPDCVGDPACPVVGVEVCDNDLDDDGDGAFDCADPDCVGTPSCPVAVREDMFFNGVPGCGDGIDNDNDGQIDCKDRDCNDPGVFNSEPCTWIEVDCADGFDNDGDDGIDCADTDCAMDPACAPAGDCAQPIVLLDPQQPGLGQITGNAPGRVSASAGSCAPGITGGEELVFQVTAPATGSYCVEASFVANPDAALYASASCGLDDVACATRRVDGSLVLPLDLQAGESSFVTLDTSGSIGLYTIEARSGACPAPPELCANGQDDDEDGLADCADPDCAADAECDPGSCTYPRALTGAGISGQLPTARASLRGVSCSTASFTEPEVVLSWTAQASGDHCFAVQTDGFGPALALIGEGSGCMSAGVCQRVIGQTLLQASFSVAQGQRYFLVLDQDTINAPGQRAYTMTVTPGACDPMATELCRDGLDNDADALIDCADPACAADTACITGELCDFNGVDDDNDGAIDCADGECLATNPFCGPETGDACVDGFDNDGSGLKDCQDFQTCGMEPRCRFGSCNNPQFASSSIFTSFSATYPSQHAPACIFGAPSGEEQAFLVDLFQPGPHCLMDTAQEIPIAVYAARDDGLNVCGDSTDHCVPPELGTRIELIATAQAGMPSAERFYVVLDSEPGATGSAQFELRQGACPLSGAPNTPLHASESKVVFASTADGDAFIEPDVNDSLSPCFALGMPVGARESVHKWRPAASGPYCISTAGSTFDTVLYVRDFFNANFGMDRVCALDGPQGSPQAAATITVMNTDQLAIIVDGQNPSAQGDYTLTITPGACP